MTDIRHYEMSPADNILYFPNNVDIRLCPKNGMSTLKELFRIHKGHNEYVGRNYRYNKVKEMGNQFEIPFRKGSYRIAVRRDPVDRFRSACEYLLSNQAEYIRQGRLDDIPLLDEEMDKVLDKIEAGTTKNNHFYTQSWYMGKPDDYDIVVHIDELSKLLVFINESSDLGLSSEQVKIHDNKTKMKMYNSILTDKQRYRIKQLYVIDYMNGWCKIDDRP